MARHLLIVDDNDRYAKNLDDFFIPLGYTTERAVTAAEGMHLIKLRGPRHYDVMVTDITMESQLAGLYMLYALKPEDFLGTVVVASTGFDVPGVLSASRLLMRSAGVHYLVPKTPLKAGEPLFYPMGFFSAPERNFVEVERKQA